MQSIKDDTIGAFNAYLGTLQKKGGGIEFSFLQFDSISIDKICVNRPVAEVAPLTDETFQPRGSTPLIDAAYATIEAVGEAVAKPKAPKVVICIQTDGRRMPRPSTPGPSSTSHQGEVGARLAVQFHGRRHRRLRAGPADGDTRRGHREL